MTWDDSSSSYPSSVPEDFSGYFPSSKWEENNVYAFGRKAVAFVPGARLKHTAAINEEGYCYLAGFPKKEVRQVRHRYGAFPDVEDIRKNSSYLGDNTLIWEHRPNHTYHVVRDPKPRKKKKFKPPNFIGRRGQKYKIGGSASVDTIIDTGRAAYGPEMLKGHIGNSLAEELRSRPATKYSMTVAQKAEVSRYIGQPVTSSSRAFSTSDHFCLQVCRDLLRTQLDTIIGGNKDDTLPSLHIGATHVDFHKWSKFNNHSFQFHMGENKDVTRTILPFANQLGAEIGKLKLPAMKALRKNDNIEVTFANFEELINVYNKTVAHFERIVLRDRVTPALRLFFPDSLYSMSKETVSEYFAKTGALEAYGIIFAPNYFLDNAMKTTDLYKIDEHWEIPSGGFEAIWPEIAFVLPILNNTVAIPVDWRNEDNDYRVLETVVRVFEKIMKTWLKTSSNMVIGWLSRAAASPFFLEGVVGLAFDISRWGSLWTKWSRLVHQHLVDRLRKITVTWRSGFENGYAHRESTWKHWVTERVHNVDGGVNLFSEVVSRIGEMWLIKIVKSTQAEPIVWQPEVLIHHRTLQIRDFAKSYNPTGGVLNWDDVWTTCREKDFYEVLAWALAEPEKSIDFQVVMTACNRVRRGLSLIANVSHDGLAVTDKDVTNFALAVYLRCHKDSSWINEIIGEEGFINSYKTRLEDFVKAVVKGALVVATGGLAIPVMYLLNWAKLETDRFEYVREPAESVHRVVYTKPNVGPSPTIDLIIPATTLNHNKCTLCSLQAMGRFGKQIFYTDKCTHEISDSQVGLTARESAEARLLVEGQIDYHRALVSPTTIDAARAFESYLSSNAIEGTSAAIKAHYILGGPGTGKSFIARELMAYYEDAGMNVGMYLPLSGLKADYDKVEMYNGTNRTFSAETFFKMARFKSLDVLFVDEFTLVNELHFKAYLNYCGATTVFFVGDTAQQNKSPEIDGGQMGISESAWFNSLDMSKHELQINFRFKDVWRVHLLNRVYGYRMLSLSGDVQSRITFVTAQEYVETQRASAELVFAHASSQIIFGRPSGNANGQENKSVYSSQGSTVENAAVALCDRDIANLDIHGAILVAITRSKEIPRIVCYDVNSEVVRTFRRKLQIEDAAAVEDVMTQPIANTQVRSGRIDIPKDEDFALNRFITDTRKNPREKVTVVKEPLKKVIKLDDDPEVLLAQLIGNRDEAEDDFDPIEKTELAVTQLDMDETILDCFETCTYDVLPAHLKSDYIRDVLIPIAEKSDFIEGDRSTFFRLKKTSKFFYAYSTNKLIVEYKDWLKFVVSRCPDLFVQKGEGTDRRYKIQGNMENFEIFHVKENHVVRKTRGFLNQQVAVRHDDVLDSVGVCDRVGNNYAGNLYSGKTLSSQPVGMISKHTPTPFSNLERKYVDFVPLPKEQFVQKKDERFESKPIARTKLRFGKDCYRLASYLDNSDGLKVVTGLENASVVSAIKGPTRPFRNSTKLSWQQTFFPRTKGKKIAHGKKLPTVKSLVAGYGNHFGDSAPETIAAAQRIISQRPSRPLSKEGMDFWDKITLEAWQENHKDVAMNDLEAKHVVAGFWQDAKTRNYAVRSEAERLKHKNILEKQLTNKAQYKPPKDGKIDHYKLGQALCQTTPEWNIRHGAAMRVVNYAYKNSLKKDVFYENLETMGQFKTRLNRGISDLPHGVSVGIMDGKEYDSGQTAGTVYAEMQHRRLMGVSKEFIESYYLCRKPGKVKYIPYLSSKMEYEKGSGFPDTLIGNTTLTEIVGSACLKGVGPKVKAIKGDDYMTMQYLLETDRSNLAQVRMYSNIDIKVEIGKGGEYCGMAVSAGGCFSSIPRLALKQIATRYKSLKHFQESQISLRDKIREIKQDGLDETMESNALSMNISKPTVELAFAVVESISHLSKDQYEKAFAERDRYRFALPNRDRTMDMYTL